ncbi:MAG: hypothetical protein SGARI_001966 [Bacillariaceae sp.]
MKILEVARQGLTRPFGDERTVKQAIDTKTADPFLMCDYLNMKTDEGPSSEDHFPVDWHPHRGFDICSYLRSGTGRHADSLGNRETYETPGMQWMSTGSGVVHAEGGGDEKGQEMQGCVFQIWINVPADRKMDDPRYGTVPTKDLPTVNVSEGVQARVLAGPAWDVQGPFETVQNVQMIDFELQPGSATDCFDILDDLDTAMLYVYEGELEKVNDSPDPVKEGSIVLFDANSQEQRGLELSTSADSGGKAMLFAGKKLKEPIAWHGPIVMNTQQQIQDTFRELRSGNFPPVRVDWDYKLHAARPS